ncbi:MAG: SRPBCC family protein [Gemmatimonadaceae bacterium]
MKWVVIAVASIVGIVLIVVLIGVLLPRDHAATMSARITAPPAEVWEALTDPSQYPKWRKDVLSVDMLPPVPTGPSWRERSNQGSIKMVMDVAAAPRRMVTRSADDNVPFGGTWECIVEPDGPSYSKVTITERGSVSNPLFRFVSRFVMGHTASIDAYLRALGEHFGSEPIPQVVDLPRGAHGI